MWITLLVAILESTVLVYFSIIYYFQNDLKTRYYSSQ